MTTTPSRAPAEHPSEPAGTPAPGRRPPRDPRRGPRPRPAPPQPPRPQDRRRRRRPRPPPRHRPADPAGRASWCSRSSAAPASSCTAPAGCSCPRRARDEAPINLDDRSRTVALVVVGVIAALALLGDSLGRLLVPVAAGDHRPDRCWSIVSVRGGSRDPRPTAVPTHADARRDAYRAGATHPGAPAPYAAPAPARPPASAGPILFWFTLRADRAGRSACLGISTWPVRPVADSAYPAVALGVIGADAAGRLRSTAAPVA